jgi:hypothetical protein
MAPVKTGTLLDGGPIRCSKWTEKRKAQWKKRYYANVEASRARSRAYYYAHKEEMYAANKRWARANSTKRIADAKKWREDLKQELLTAYGRRCACCGETEIRFLTLEHINRDGAAHRKAKGTYVYPDVRRQGFPKDKYCLLCFNCNHATKTGADCPHKIKLNELTSISAA